MDWFQIRLSHIVMQGDQGIMFTRQLKSGGGFCSLECFLKVLIGFKLIIVKLSYVRPIQCEKCDCRDSFAKNLHNRVHSALQSAQCTLYNFFQNLYCI